MGSVRTTVLLLLLLLLMSAKPPLFQLSILKENLEPLETERSLQVKILPLNSDLCSSPNSKALIELLQALNASLEWDVKMRDISSAIG